MNISFQKYLHVSCEFRNICAFRNARLLTYHFQGSWKVYLVEGPRPWTCKFPKTPEKFSEFLHRNSLQIDKLWRSIGPQCRTPLDFQCFKAQVPYGVPFVSLIYIFSCDQAALQTVFSVCLSVCLSHLFDYVPIIVSSQNFQELLPMTKVRSMQKVKVKGQGHRGHNPTEPFPDCNSSLNSHMMIKWCI